MSADTPSPENDSLAGRLQRFAPAWSSIAPSRWQRVLQKGYHWTWKSKPPTLSLPKLLVQSKALQVEVQALLEKGAIYPVSPEPCFLAKIFAIPKPNGKVRLILDVSRLNEFIFVPELSFKNHGSFRKALVPPAWVVTLDLKEAYYHVPMHPRLHKFLALTCWGKLFYFKVLPFGLSPAPWVFQSLMSFPITRLQTEGVKVLSYLDDVVIWNPCKRTLLEHSHRAIETLSGLGFSINLEKSELVPSRTITWLGIQWDALAGTWALPPAFRLSITEQAASIIEANQVCRRGWEKLLGSIAFAAQVSPVARRLRHSLLKFRHLPGPEDRDRLVPLPRALRNPLLPWLAPTLLAAPAPLHNPPVSYRLWTDASKTGWGALGSDGRLARGAWSRKTAESHINLLEWLAVIRAFLFLKLQNHHVLVLSDNACVVGSAKKLGSKSPQVHRQVHKFLKLAERTKCTFEFRHIRGRENVVADSLSRNTPQEDEWSIPSEEFRRLESNHGRKLQVDLFATPVNKKVANYFCPFSYPLAAGKDAYSKDLNQFDQIYAFPPPNQAARLLEFLQSYHGGGLLILPNRSALLVLLPMRDLVFPLVLSGPPTQEVQGLTYPHPEGSNAFLAWSFSKRRLGVSSGQK